MHDNRPIGIFDSGVGGLSVLYEIKKLLPRESFIYVADQANIPYSGKSKKELEKITSNIVRFLVERRAKIIVVACNTATLYVLDYLRSEFDIPIIGIVPVVKTAAERTKNGRVGILSTVATAKSNYQKELIKRFTSGLKVSNIGTDEIVSFIENGNVNSKELNNALKRVLKQFSGVDVLALGCSHYPFLRDKIQTILGSKVLILDSGPAVARQVERVLEKNRAFSSGKERFIKFFTSGNPSNFRTIAEKLIKMKFDPDIIGVDTVEKAII